MKKNLVLPLLLSLSLGQIKTAPVKLEAGIIATVDGLVGLGIDGEVIALIKQYQGEIMKMLVGKPTPQGRIGKYSFNGTAYNVQQLSKIEAETGNNPTFTKLRIQMRDDFEAFSIPFRKNVNSAKAVMTLLIEESCSKRNRLNSVLYVWSKTDEKNEYELFDMHIKSIRDLEIFLTDLHNFLSDLVYSCPKALVQYNEMIQKFKKVKEVASLLKIPTNELPAFLKFANKQLSRVSLGDINQDKVTEFYRTFNQ